MTNKNKIRDNIVCVTEQLDKVLPFADREGKRELFTNVIWSLTTIITVLGTVYLLTKQ